jgi:hypothetical protein
VQLQYIKILHAAMGKGAGHPKQSAGADPSQCPQQIGASLPANVTEIVCLASICDQAHVPIWQPGLPIHFHKFQHEL